MKVTKLTKSAAKTMIWSFYFKSKRLDSNELKDLKKQRQELIGLVSLTLILLPNTSKHWVWGYKVCSPKTSPVIFCQSCNLSELQFCNLENDDHILPQMHKLFKIQMRQYMLKNIINFKIWHKYKMLLLFVTSDFLKKSLGRFLIWFINFEHT